MPFAAIVNKAGGADCAEDGVSAGSNRFRVFDDHLRSATKFHAAQGVEANGVGVAIDIAAVHKIEIRGDARGATPMQKRVFDFRTLGMTANDAFACMALRRLGTIASREPGVDSGTFAIRGVAKFSL